MAQLQAKAVTDSRGSLVVAIAKYDNSKFMPANGIAPWRCISTGKLEQEALDTIHASSSASSP
jgi:hypothetical protein